MAKWTGSWIWYSGEECPKNSYLYVRKIIDLPRKASKATARVCADSRYILYINGKLIGRGPARSFPKFQHFDEYDLTKALKKGKNVIAALVHHYGEDTFQYHLGRGAFLFDADIESDGKNLSVVSDADWKVQLSDAWYRNLSRISIQQGYSEIYDMNKAPEGWAEADFDDSGWEDATVVGPVGSGPWKLIPRGIPYLTEHLIYPAKVLHTGAADASELEPKVAANDMSHIERREGTGTNVALIQQNEKREKGVKGLFTNASSFVRLPQITDLLQSSILKPNGEPEELLQTRCDESNALLKDVVIKPSPDGRSSFVALDFGKEVVGFVRLKIKSNSGGVVDLGYSEMLEDGNVVPNRCGLTYADRVILKPGEQEFQTFDKRAFQFMQLDFRDLNGPVVLESVGVEFTTYPVKWRGDFACSDNGINEIRQMSAYTVQLNMEDAYTDCPWRERTAWMGDARVEALVNYYVFGDDALARQLWREIARSQHDDGITNCFAPGDLGPCEPIPSFCLIWIMSIWDYYQFMEDKELVVELYPNVKKALKYFTSRINELGLCANLPYWMFIDWAPIDIRGAVTTLNCFLVGALRDAAQMAKLADKDSDAKSYLSTADKLARNINKHLFVPEKGVYADCHCDGEISKTISEHSNSLAVLYDIAPRESWQHILDYIHNPENEVVRAGSPYFSFYVLQALWKAGQKDRAFDYIRTKWGWMRDQGATVCWEHWHNEASLCHGWSGGPAADLPAQVLGVRPLAPGFKLFEVSPATFGLDWAECVVPSIRGDIEVYWKREKGFTLGVTVPKRTKAIVTLPEPADPESVKINGEKKLPDNVKPLKSVDGKPAYAVKGPAVVEFRVKS